MLARGVAVENIFVTIEGKNTRKAAALTPFARVEGERVWYPALDEPVRGLFDLGAHSARLSMLEERCECVFSISGC